MKVVVFNMNPGTKADLLKWKKDTPDRIHEIEFVNEEDEQDSIDWCRKHYFYHSHTVHSDV